MSTSNVTQISRVPPSLDPSTALRTVQDFLSTENARQEYPVTLVLDTDGNSSTLQLSLNGDEDIGFNRALFEGLTHTPSRDTTEAGRREAIYESADNIDDLEPIFLIPAVHIPNAETGDKLMSANTLGKREMVHVKIAWKAEAHLISADDANTTFVPDNELPDTICVTLTTESWRDITESLLHVDQPLDDMCMRKLDFEDSSCLHGTSRYYDPPESKLREELPSGWELDTICITPVMYLSSWPTYIDSPENQESAEDSGNEAVDEDALFDMFCNH